MRYLLSSLVQIALLRKDPSVLPASILLLALTAGPYVAVNAVHARIIHGPDRLLARVVAELAVALALFWALLAVSGRLDRYRQTMSAVFGTYVLVSPFVAGLLLLAKSSQSITLVMWLGSAIIISWYTLIVGHILRSATDIGFATSIAIALCWLFGGDVLLNRLFAMTA